VAVPGGKGINVARVLRELGGNVRIMGFAGGATGDVIRRGLDAEGLSQSLTAIDDDSRTCWAVTDPLHLTATEVNEPGATIRPSELADFLTTYRMLVRGAGLVVLSGSLPVGVPPSIYADLITEAWEHGVPCTLDTGAAEAFALGLAAGPLLVKPNAHEAEALVGQPLTTVEQADGAARALLAQGALLAAVTMGARGALLRSPRGGWLATPPPITPVNTVGSGDAFLAGFVARFLRALPERPTRHPEVDRHDATAEGGFLAAARDTTVLREALALGTASGAANALMPRAGQVRPSDVHRLLPQVEIVDLPA
jgi:tagatose 6-phosphate kinase